MLFRNFVLVVIAALAGAAGMNSMYYAAEASHQSKPPAEVVTAIKPAPDKPKSVIAGKPAPGKTGDVHDYVKQAPATAMFEEAPVNELLRTDGFGPVKPGVMNLLVFWFLLMLLLYGGMNTKAFVWNIPRKEKKPKAEPTVR